MRISSTPSILLAAALLLQAAAAQCPPVHLKASPPVSGQNFGWDVALHGQRALVGRADQSPTDPGTAFVFEPQGASWQLTATLQPPDGFASYFGSAVALGPDRAIVGDPGDDEVGEGAVHVFERLGGAWIHVQKLHPNDPLAADSFGLGVAVDGDTLVVGAPGDSTTCASFACGSAYVFRLQGSTWIQEAKIAGSALSTGHNFGARLDVDGDVVVLGTSGGSAYVFERSGTNWTEVARLQPTGGSTTSFFGPGRDVAVSGSTILVGYSGYSGPDTLGAAFVYERLGTAWAETAVLLPDPADPEDLFGWAVALSGDLAVVGAPGQLGGQGQSGYGRAYALRRDAGGWDHVGVLPPLDPLAFSSYSSDFGWRAAVDGDLAVVSDPYERIWQQGSAGAVYAFDLAPLPETYCSAKVNSLGCVPEATANGTPSATDPAPVDVGARMVLNNRNGLLFYGISGRAAIPLNGGLLCAAPPLRRTAFQNAFGSAPPANDCSGTFTFDFSALVQSGSDPLLVPGQQINAQHWTRDPQHPDGTGVGLTDAVELGICP